MYFEFGSIEDHFKYRQAVMEAYPCGNYPVFEGYDHMQYQIRDPKGFAEMLTHIIEHDGMPKLPVYQKVRDTDMKHKIEKNTVQETLILPLYSRKLCTELYPNLYRDETAVRLIDEIDYDFSEAEKNSRSLMQRFGALEVAMRQNDLAWEVRDYLKTHPGAAVVNLGCGLDNTGRACDNGSLQDLQSGLPRCYRLAAAASARRGAGAKHPLRPERLPHGLTSIDATGGAVFFASGVFYYFLTEQVKALVQRDGGRFSRRRAGV